MANQFRSLLDVQRYLKEQENQMRTEFQIIDNNLKELKAMAVHAIEIKVMDFSGTKIKRRTISTDFPVVDVPNKAKLEKNYRQAERLSQQYKALVQTENEVKMTFRNATNENFQSLLGQFTKLKSDIQKKLKELFTELSSVAEGHAPKEYKKFIAGLAEELNDNQHIECDGINTFTYVGLTTEGQLMFAGYIVLINAVSDEGKVIPHLYVTTRWTVGGDVEIFVEHEFVEPTLLRGGTVIENTKEATKAIVDQLTLEGFSSQLGNLPALMQLKRTEHGLSKEAFSVAPFIKSIEAEREQLVFHLKPTVTNKEIEEIKYQLFLEVKSMLKHKRSTKIKMRVVGKDVEFTFANLDAKGVTSYDLDFLQEKYKLNDSQIRRIANEING